MSASRNILSDQDIQRLVRSDNADDRAVATHKVCRLMERSELSDVERAAAQEIIRLLAEDAADLVRRALAVTLRTSSLLPRDVAMRLAQDIHEVSVPVLSHSPAFTDEDLTGIIRQGDPSRQVAVARREVLSETVTSALARHAVEEAVVIACANDNALFSEAGMGEVLARFSASEVVQNALVNRLSLPAPIREKLVHMVSQSLRDQLITRHAVLPEAAAQIAEATQERATIDIADQAGTDAGRDPGALARHLVASGRMSPSLMLRALARGHMPFFEYALAELAGVPHDRAWLMVHDAGALGLRALYERAGLPARLFQTFRIAVDTYHALASERGDLDPLRFQSRMIERFLTQMPFAPREDLVYLYERLDRDTRGRRRAGPSGHTQARRHREEAA